MILTTLFLIPTVLIKKRFLPIFIFLLNIGAVLILGEFAKVNLKTSLILLLFTTLILLLIFIKNRITNILGFILLFLLLSLSFWQGDKFQYKSNIIDKENITEDYNFFTYGRNGDIPTYSIDSSSYYKGNSGLAGWYDRTYWKLTTNLPLNGRVYYPKKYGSYPLIIVVHGNHLAESSSQFGYDYLLKNFANRGYIAISIDENFLNGNWTTLGLGLPKENDTRGYLILEHLKLIKKWNSDKNSKLYKMINMDEIGLIGHSRGGEAISIAAAKKAKFNIKALMALSPTDRQYRENIYLKDISYITLHGANDGDLIKFKGRGQYNRVEFEQDTFNFKASYYIEGLNHVQFNSDWGKVDSTSLGKLFYGKNLNVKAEDQMEIAKELGEVFFDIVLKNKPGQISKLKYPETIKTLPSVRYITDYNANNYTALYNFQNSIISEDIYFKDFYTEYVYRRNNRSLLVEGSKDKTITFTNKYPREQMKMLYMSLASNRYKDQDLTIKLIKDEVIISSWDINLKSALTKNRFKTHIFEYKESVIENHFQHFEFPVDQWDLLQIESNTEDTSFLIDNISYSL